MSYGTYEGTTWPVDIITDDTPEREWLLRYNPAYLTTKDFLFIASVMAAYRHLTDPEIDDEEAVTALGRARLVTREVHNGREEVMKDRVEKTHVLIDGSSVMGPYTLDEAVEVKGKIKAGQILPLRSDV